MYLITPGKDRAEAFLVQDAEIMSTDDVLIEEFRKNRIYPLKIWDGNNKIPPGRSKSRCFEITSFGLSKCSTNPPDITTSKYSLYCRCKSGEKKSASVTFSAGTPAAANFFYSVLLQHASIRSRMERTPSVP
jgi:hypothetical protein